MADPEEEAIASAIKAFSEDNLDTYDESVRGNFAAAIRQTVATLSAKASAAGVSRPEAESGRYTRALIIRDMMAASVQIADSVAPVPREVVLNQWLPPRQADSPGSDGNSEDPEKTGSDDDVVGSPDFSDPVAMKTAWKHMMASMTEMQVTLQSQQLRITRLAAPGVKREYGIGLADLRVLQESKGLLWPTDASPFEQKPVKSQDHQALVQQNSADELSLWRRLGFGASNSS